MYKEDVEMKIVIIINGRGGAGKDTLCGFAAEGFKSESHSSIDPIKEIASKYGWKGDKDSRSRKFLSDLKRVFAEYNDLPTVYLMEKYHAFLQNGNELFFAHIREAEEIKKFKSKVESPCVTLLIRRNDRMGDWGNASDDGVEDIAYDYVYDNDRDLDTARREFIELMNKIGEDLGFHV
ncbi:MAG: hypothetical protein J6O55_05420 [Lachnospiraceae bacterium]|nr:hypothetical protein [Lachnospiraceae bacterium]